MKYKIVKKRELYHVYKKKLLFFWIRIGFEATLERAENWIVKDKHREELRKIQKSEKPELIGYYE